ncbi:sigma-70 family RNA polymerase sigma factor [Paenibacillus sp. HN-1]|uniref:sigma-70 family RNA polymerase sigma factor n=1 Tax=Paenibacillus TaxID=44249 RepID=UPI001CA9668E|nr:MULTISPECIES: sigma-70 family RNA polymerase sigma factor [Paenibacillus]MBY9082366.1 sigma-70 family RNA polymerase sigma factor [Paenibacillus sp. CGMCC 1.18879]MBY9085330.1 sigma-70 family RNA polymerase sigma factor [Paenibacillus sinensis]
MNTQIDFNPNLGYLDEVIEQHKKLVHSIAQRYRRRCNANIAYEDLISEGVIGLMQAFRRFDPDGYGGKPVKFSTYAGSYIQGMMQQLLERHSSSVRTPRALYYAAGKIIRSDEEEPAEIAAELQMDPKLVEEALAYLQAGSVRSLDQAVSLDGETDLTLMDTLGKEDDQTEVLIEEFKSFLDDRDYAIFSLLLRGEGQPEIAAALNISQSYVSRLLTLIKDKLQRYIQNPESEEWKMSNETRRGRPPGGAVTLLDGVEWYAPELSPSIPQCGLNSLGMSINKEAATLLNLNAGDFVQIGFNSKLMRLVIQKAIDNASGSKVMSTSGKNGAVATNNKAIARWINHRRIAKKRYELQVDGLTGIHFLQVEIEKEV